MLMSGWFFRRAHRDAPDPVALSKKNDESRNKGNVGSVLLLDRLDTAQNFRIEIHQPEPEKTFFLFTDPFRGVCRCFREQPAPAGGIDKPARRSTSVCSRRDPARSPACSPFVLVQIDSNHTAPSISSTPFTRLRSRTSRSNVNRLIWKREDLRPPSEFRRQCRCDPRDCRLSGLK